MALAGQFLEISGNSPETDVAFAWAPASSRRRFTKSCSNPRILRLQDVVWPASETRFRSGNSALLRRCRFRVVGLKARSHLRRLKARGSVEPLSMLGSPRTNGSEKRTT